MIPMNDWASGTWLAIGALASTFVVGMLAYVRQPPFVAASRLTDMRQTIERLRDEVRDLRDQVARLEATLAQTRDEAQWLMRRLRTADDAIAQFIAERAAKPTV